MPIGTLRRSRKTKKLLADVKVKKEYAKYYAATSKSRVLSYAQWLKERKGKGGKKIAYYGQGRETADTILRRLKRK